jgi:hypothetical protein
MDIYASVNSLSNRRKYDMDTSMEVVFCAKSAKRRIFSFFEKGYPFFDKGMAFFKKGNPLFNQASRSR